MTFCLTKQHAIYIEGTNNGLKRGIPVRCRVKDGIYEHLMEFIWRRKHEKANIWDVFIEALRDIHYDME
jgi:hypothetical protein